jgi:chromosome segregation ATPase
MRLFQPFTQEMLGAATRFIRLEIEAEHLRSAHGLAKKRADDLEAKLEAAKKALEGAQSKVTAEEEKRAEERSKLAAEEEKRGEEKSRMVARDEKIHQCHEELNTSFISESRFVTFPYL